MKIDLREFQAALDRLKTITEQAIKQDQDFADVLTTATGNNFTLMLIPSREVKYAHAVAALMNGGAA